MDKNQILEKLAEVVIDGSEDEAKALAREVVATKMDPLEAIEQGLSKGMETMGARFESGRGLPAGVAHGRGQLQRGHGRSEAGNRSPEEAGCQARKGPDRDGQGRTCTRSARTSSPRSSTRAGFEVVDMGVDNPSLNIIQEAQKSQVDVIALSSVMTTTMPAQKEVIDTLKEMGIREKYFVIIGGGPRQSGVGGPDRSRRLRQVGDREPWRW